MKWGRNIAQGLIADRKGSAESSHEGSVANLLDGEGTYLTFNLAAFASAGIKFGERFLEFDLGTSYWVDTVQMWYNLFAGGGRLSGASFNIYEIQISDGTPAAGGGLIWTAPEQVRGIGKETETNRFQPMPARFVRVSYPFIDRSVRNEGTKARIREVQLYGEGYHPEVELVSGLIPLGSAKNLVSIEWEADTPPGTSVQIQTRTGNEIAEAYRYHDSGGVEVSAGKYEKLGFLQERAGSTPCRWLAPTGATGVLLTRVPATQLLRLARVST